MTLLQSRMRQTVTVASVSSTSSYGDPTFGAQRTIRAQVTRKTRRRSRGAVTEEVSTPRLLTYDKVSEGDRVWLPGADVATASTAQTVRSVEVLASTTDGRTLYGVEV